MGGASSFLAMLAIAGFLTAAWLASKLSRLAGVSSIVLEITTGVVFGPGVLGLISDEYAVCEHKRHTECQVPANFDDLVASGQSFGASLERIAAMDYCNPHNWDHAEDHGAGAAGETHHGDEADGAGEPHGPQGPHTEGRGATPAATTGSPATENAGEALPTTHMAGATTPGCEGTLGGCDHVDAMGEPPAGSSKPQTLAPTTHAATHAATTEVAMVSSTEAPTTSEPASTRASTPALGSELQGQEDDQGDGAGVRRLSGGGGGAEYATYAECLEKSCEADISHHCGLTPDVFTLIGHTGVALMIFESGMHFDFEKARVVGPKACAVAVLGTILPLISGTILTVIYGKPMVPDGVSVGTALAPTSVGIALRLLGEAGVLSYDFGQAIITAAFVDDILSLVLFNVLFSLKGDFDAFKVVVSPIIGIVFMIVAMVAAVKFWPRAINDYILPRIPIKKGEFKVSSSDEALFLIMFALLVAYATATHFLGTHLWGCFIAGMSFACVKPMHHPHHVWVTQTKRITTWMIRIFFAATVAFSIPVDKLLSIEAFLKGSLMGIFPCIATKVLCAPFMGDAKFVIGWAMVGRAEFAYLIAQMAAAASMIDEETFSITIWALLYATIFAPFVFRTVLKRYIERNALVGLPSEQDEGEEGLAEGHADSAPGAAEKDFAGSEGVTTYGRDFAELNDIKLDVDGSGARPEAPAASASGGTCGKGLMRCLAFNGGNNVFSR